MRFNCIQKAIDILRGKKTALALILKNNNIEINKTVLKNVELNIQGENNTVIIKNKNITGKIYINLYGDNNYIELSKGLYIGDNINITIGQKHPNFGKVYNCEFKVEENVSFEGLNYSTVNSNSFCKIEKNCMFSSGISICNTDFHPIFKKDTKEIVNKVDGVIVGEHSWIGKNVTILKNSIIPKNSIVGYGAMFCGKNHQKTFCAFAGNPAKVVKENVDWDANGAKYGYIENNK